MWKLLLLVLVAAVAIISYIVYSHQAKHQKMIPFFHKTFATLTYPYSLPSLPYAHNALEPYIDEQTMRIHHGKHHQGYVNKLNAALENHAEYQKMSLVDLLSNLDSLPESIRIAVRNNAGGHFNHTLFWEMMSETKDQAPQGKLLDAINNTFGSFDKFKEAFSNAGKTRFGSGWAWLCLNEDQELVVTSTPNQDAPLEQGLIPILALDVWEHAYYLKYQNKRPDYLEAWWHVANWKVVEKYYNKALVAMGSK